MAKSPPPKQTSSSVSSLAAKVLSGELKNPSPTQIKSLAGSALGQDQTKGQATKRR
jgi:hypothetical protein